jgi:nickel/cobalt transporter (NicO) family protein
MQPATTAVWNLSLLLCMLMGALGVFAGPLAAHPHVWIEARSNVVFDDKGQIIAVDHRWTMDEMYTEAAIDGLDKNGDGLYSPEELQPLTKENIDSLKEYDYFTSFKAGNQKRAFGEVVEASQFWKDKRLTLSFRLPLKEPVDPVKTNIVYRVYDPGFFIAIEFPDQTAVATTGTVPARCRIELQEPVSDQQTADTKAMLATKGVDWQAPPEEDFGAMFAQPIAVSCGAAPQAVAAEPTDLSGRSIVGPRQGVSFTPSFWADPAAFILATQQAFYERISGAISGLRSGPSWAAAWTLMLLSFGYGVFHAAGPGHGKTVISGWVLATEQQLKRGIMISFASAFIQALSAILIVTTLLFLVKTVGSTARSVAAMLETASYGFIALLGFYLLWQAMGMIWPSKPALASGAVSGSSRHDDHHHDHAHAHGQGCGHSHMPTPRELSRNWSLSKALSVSLAVGIRPCTGAILALLFANAVGVYWAGIAATFIMSIGTALTVSAIAIIAVFSKAKAMSMLGGRQNWLNWAAFGLRLGGGLLIAFLGATLFWGSLHGISTPG